MPAMDEIKLSLSQAGPTGELSIIRVDGVVDTITASQLEGVIETLIAQERYKIDVDLGGVEYISAAGWGIYISRIQASRDHQGDLKLVNMIPNVYEIYELLEFENVIPAFESLEQGKRAFNLPSAGDGNSDRIWRAEDKIVPEQGMALQAAMAPGSKGSSSERSPLASVRRPSPSAASSDTIILQLIAEDPFSSIAELSQQTRQVAPQLSLGWWQIFGILRRHKLLSRRARFRHARRQARQR